MAEISVIIPVFNTVNYLDRCISSIKSQSFRDFEVIVIDDGSTDGSGARLKELIQDDERFTLFLRENHGVSLTRQFGLEQVCSKYVTFVDSDDWVQDTWLKELYTEAEVNQCDIVWCDMTKVFEDHEENFSQTPAGYSTEDVLADLMCGKIWGSCCNKLVRMSCIEKYNASFHSEMNMWEDLHFFWHLMKHDLKWSYIPKPLYNYDCFSSSFSIVRYRKASHIKSASVFVKSVTEQDFLPFCSRGSAVYDRIQCGIYRRKCMILRWAFHLHDDQMPVRDLFPEIHERFIAESSQEPFWSENRCIALALKGYNTTSHVLYSAFENTFKLRSKNRGK